MPRFQPTDEQELIASIPMTPGVMGLVQGYAGAAKTSTMELVAERNPRSRILYLAYNKAMVEEARRRLPSNVRPVTVHGVAFGVTGKQYSHKLGNLRATHIMDAFGIGRPSDAKLVVEILNQYFNGIETDLDHSFVNDIPADTLTRRRLLDVARKTWQKMQDTTSPIPMAHDGYLKLWHLSKPIISGYNMVILDEAQDSNPITLSLARRTFEDGRAGLILAGDAHQSIYGFRLASNAMAAMEGFATHPYVLTKSWRYTPETAAMATGLLTEWKGIKNVIKGMGSGCEAEDATYIARTNGWLIEQGLSSLRAGKRIHFAGTVEADNWNPARTYKFDAVRDVLSIRQGRLGAVNPGYYQRFKSSYELEEIVKSEADPEITQLWKLVERHGGNLETQLAQLERACCAPDKAECTFSSAHRSKGLEWGRTVIADDFPKMEKLAEQRAKLGDAWEQEINLMYVALTRSKGATGIMQADMALLMERYRKEFGVTRAEGVEESAPARHEAAPASVEVRRPVSNPAANPGVRRKFKV